MAGDTQDRSASRRSPATPLLEWLSASIGFTLLLGTFGYIGWQALHASDDAPPALAVIVERIVDTGSGYAVEFTVRNRSRSTAAAVRVQGELKQGGNIVETAEATLDYVPGRSQRGGGLIFAQDPRSADLKVRALGYAEP